jgi:hypothetical protein
MCKEGETPSVTTEMCKEGETPSVTTEICKEGETPSVTTEIFDFSNLCTVWRCVTATYI